MLTVNTVAERIRFRVSSMTVESWKLVFEIGGLIALMLSFVFGGGAWWTTNRLNRRQDEQLRQFNKSLAEAKTAQHLVEIDLARQREKTAEAELRLLEVRRALEPRMLVIVGGDVQSRLSKFRDTPFLIRVTMNGEARGVASATKQALMRAGWSNRGTEIMMGTLRAGILVETQRNGPLFRAADELVEYFTANRVSAQNVSTALTRPELIVISIGAKPMPLSLSGFSQDEDDVEQLTKIDEAVRKSMEDTRRKWHLSPYE